MQMTEEQINGRLDGTFTRVCGHTGRVDTKIVPLDYIPTHAPPKQPSRETLQRAGRSPRHHWTPQEDAELQRLRRLGWSKLRCSHHFNVTEESVRRRLETLRMKRYYGEMT